MAAVEYHDWTKFKKWALSNGYEKGLHIDRINNEGDYCPENCRWVKAAVNMRNKRTTKLSSEEVTEIIREWKAGNVLQRELAEKFGVCQQTISRITIGATWQAA